MKVKMIIVILQFCSNCLFTQDTTASQNCFLTESRIILSENIFEGYESIYRDFNLSKGSFHFLYLISQSGSRDTKLIEVEMTSDTLNLKKLRNGELVLNRHEYLNPDEFQKIKKWYENLEKGSYSLACASIRSSPYTEIAMIKNEEGANFLLYMNTSCLKFLAPNQMKKIENSSNLISYFLQFAGIMPCCQ